MRTHKTEAPWFLPAPIYEWLNEPTLPMKETTDLWYGSDCSCDNPSHHCHNIGRGSSRRPFRSKDYTTVALATDAGYPTLGSLSEQRLAFLRSQETAATEMHESNNAAGEIEITRTQARLASERASKAMNRTQSATC